MKKEDLIELKEKISKLTDEELKLRDLHLKGLADGTIQGPPVGYPSVDKPWLKHYSKSSLEIDLPKIKAYDLIYRNNKDNLKDVAIEFMDKKVTYGELFSKIEDTAKALKQLGVKKGDIVTMAMATSPELAYVFYALNRIGAVANAVDPRYTFEEFKEKIDETNSKYFIGINMSTSKIDKHKEELGLTEIVEVSPVESSKNPIIKSLVNLNNKKTNTLKWKEFIKNGKLYNGEIDSEYEEHQTAVIVYTGGTTGIPKGVMLPNESFITMSYNNEISIDNQYERGETMLNFLPPFSAYSMVNALHDPLSWGFKTIMIPLFKPTDFPKLMAKYKPNHVLSGPILWDYMMNDKKYSNTDLSFLKSPVSGGDSMNAEFEKKINDYLEKHGCKYKIQQGYGMTEVSAAATYSTEKSYELGSVGAPYFKNSVSAFDVDTGDEKETGMEGEIKISTPTLMNGYYNRQEATDEIVSQDVDGKKWINTGDIGYVDKNGNVFIKGRIKRLIVRKGNKIFPINIEKSICELSEIENCAVVGMPNKEEKTVPVAYIVLNDDAEELTQIVSNIKNKILETMPDFNIPYKFIFTDEIPLTDMAKVNFKLLEDESIDYVEREEIIDNREKSKQIS